MTGWMIRPRWLVRGGRHAVRHAVALVEGAAFWVASLFAPVWVLLPAVRPEPSPTVLAVLLGAHLVSLAVGYRHNLPRDDAVGTGNGRR
ncbi:MAG: hypothetical protein V5A23_06650 [Halobacteriales archaeon]